MKETETKELSARDQFIVDMAKKGFTPYEIVVLMKRHGFKEVARSRIYQILAAAEQGVIHSINGRENWPEGKKIIKK